MKTLLFALTVLVCFTACQNNTKMGSEKSVKEIKSEDQITNSDIIRNPVSADEPTDTVNVAKISFEQATFDFGTVDEGEVVTHVFEFTNTGKVPLLINNARSTCGCTVPQWPKDPIPPGERGEIEVRFNTKNKRAKQNKPVTITANTYPATTKVFLVGTVVPEEGEEATSSK